MADPKTTATISADGRIYTGFKAVTVRRVYGDTISTFSFTCSDAKSEAAGLLPGARCVIKLGGVKALDGFITDRGVAYDGSTHDVVIAGKSLTTDPADSSAPIQPGNFDGFSAQQIARGLLQPHSVGLNVINPPPGFDKAFPYFAINPAETAMAAIGRAMVMRGCFMWDDAGGNLCVGQGSPRAAVVADLQEGRNILLMVSKISDQNAVNIFSTVGQQPGIGDDFATRNAQAQVLDPSARSNRIRVEHMWHPGDSQDAASQAGLLAAYNGWRSVELEVTVQGWLRPDGKLWNVLDNVSVYSPMAIPNGTGSMILGIQALNFSLGSNDHGEGATTTLSLKKPELLTSVGHAGVQADGAGRILGATPQPAQPVPPDAGQ